MGSLYGVGYIQSINKTSGLATVAGIPQAFTNNLPATFYIYRAQAAKPTHVGTFNNGLRYITSAKCEGSDTTVKVHAGETIYSSSITNGWAVVTKTNADTVFISRNCQAGGIGSFATFQYRKTVTQSGTGNVDYNGSYYAYQVGDIINNDYTVNSTVYQWVCTQAGIAGRASVTPIFKAITPL